MTNIADLSDHVHRATGGSSGTPEPISWFRGSRVGAAAATAPVAGREVSLWQYNGNPSHGEAAAAVTVPTNTTQGGMIQTNPGGGRQKWLTGGWAVGNVAGTLILYDRLRQIGGLSGTNTAAQTTNGAAITRNTGGVGNEIWIEIQTLIGTTATTATCQYVNQAGATVTSPAFAIGGTGLREAQRIIRVPLAAGDNGVQDVLNLDLLATTGTAGNIAVILARPLASVALPAVGLPGRIVPFLYPTGDLEIDTNACLAWSFVANSTGIPEIRGGLFFVEA